MKSYRNVKDIVSSLEEFDLIDGSVAIQNCGLPEQEIIDDVQGLKDSPPNYWTLILAKRKKSDAAQKK